jgi:DNA-binding CsgD family transcriptional regulator
MCRFDQGRRLAAEAQASLKDPAAREQIAVLVATLILGMEGFTAALTTLEPILERAPGQNLGWPTVLAEYALLRVGRLETAIALTDTGDSPTLTLSESGSPYRAFEHPINRCNALVHAGQLEAAEAVALDQHRQGIANGSSEWQAMFAWMLARMVVERGRVATSIRYGREGITLLPDTGQRLSQHDAMNSLALALALGGYSREAAAVLTDQEAMGLPPSIHTEVERLRAHAWVAAANQDLPTARRFLREAAQVGARIGDHVYEAAVLHDIARLGRPREVVDRLGTLTTTIDGQLVHARSAHAGALAHRDGAGLEKVSIHFEAMGARLFAAEAAADAAVAWQSSGRSRRASAAVQRAALLAERCEGATTPALRTVDARARLSGAERDTALLAAQGHTSRQIANQLNLSVRTVENRLQRTYEKLGISSRKDLYTALGLG